MIHIFDIDGTLALHRYLDKAGYSSEQWIRSLIEHDMYAETEPSKSMVKICSGLDPDDTYICSRISLGSEVMYKNNWIDKYFPYIPYSNRYYTTDNISKLYVAEHIHNEEGRKVYFIDDSSDVIDLLGSQEKWLYPVHVIDFIENYEKYI